MGEGFDVAALGDANDIDSRFHIKEVNQHLAALHSFFCNYFSVIVNHFHLAPEQISRNLKIKGISFLRQYFHLGIRTFARLSEYSDRQHD